MTHHPIRDIEIWGYSGPHGGIATFEDGRVFPVIARGATMAEAMNKLEVFRTDIIEKHEASVVRKIEAKAARDAEKAAKEQVAA